jgi:ribosomal protein S18 acetylase RimI-like enzyme
MKLLDNEKLDKEPLLWEITEACYTGVEVPTREFFKLCVQKGDVFVRYEDNEIASYALVNGGRSDCPLLRSIATKPKYRKHGHAWRLLTELSLYYQAAHCSQIILYCKVDNPAQCLYFKAGYRVTALLRGYYKPEGNGLEMRKTL